MLKISENRRFLVHADGSPFFYLGDTAWELFHRLTREEAQEYLRDRASKRFSVIQAVALAEFDGLTVPNAYGHLPLMDGDPSRPNEDYFEHVDWIVARANQLGLYVGLLPTWGDKWNQKWGVGPQVFTPQNAQVYGAWLGARYRNSDVIWILGGDRPMENDTHRETVDSMARAIRTAAGRRHLMTLHPCGGRGSSEWIHSDEWLDFNMRQNGHEIRFAPRYAATRADYDLVPAKPVIDGEPVYEDHPIAFKAQDHGHSLAADVRRPLYWDLFTGACGHTYGHHSIWQFHDKARKPVNNPLFPWREAMQRPGAAQMQHGRALMESRPFLTRVPDDSIIAPADVPTAVPGAGLGRLVATRDTDRTYAMIYCPTGRAFKADLGAITGQTVRAWWYNPRTGAATAIGELANDGAREFVPPDVGEYVDWVLVLDDAARNYPPPGAMSTGSAVGRSDPQGAPAQGRHSVVGPAAAADPPLEDCDDLPLPDHANLPLVDYHVHLEGEIDLARALQLSAERGVRFGLVEHGGRGQNLSSDADLERYLDELSDRPVFAGMQAEGLDWMECFSEEAVARLDFVLTDALTFPDRDGTILHLWTPEIRIADPDDFIGRYLDYHVRIISTEPIDIMANPTFLPWCLADRYGELWTPDRMDRLIASAVAHDVALEINARYRVPSHEFVRRAKAAGARFAFGTNYHSQDVGKLDYCVQTAQACGLTQRDLFVPRRLA